jgi:hypothetical protein
MIVTDEQGNLYTADEWDLKPYHELPPNLKVLVESGTLTEVEARLILTERQKATIDPETPSVLRDPPAETPQKKEPANRSASRGPFGHSEPGPEVPPCSKNRGGRHIFQGHVLTEDGKIIGRCKCGYQGEAPCPHKKQAYDSKRKVVVCAWCQRDVIGGTGFDERIPRQLPGVGLMLDPDLTFTSRGDVVKTKYKGNL